MNKLPTKQDFDAAVKQNWTAQTCVVAQMCLRITGKPLYSIIPGRMCGSPQTGWGTLKRGQKCNKIMNIFDNYFFFLGDGAET